ncbi:MAG: ABC transporter ATP-binding protein [Euryhalocaulis sp.]|uniref:ABC transporter ATP-binding protein n=1 Tax=Euryhalocaulis sp. TaxID=2744307 RepID=UPI0017B61761|nr:ABC transporter ATP-binding protein [Euryhalocaulis sp.]MBA4802310.1 ABC transporter ATP-binding protein [Euryhalocaulis sp.]
MARLVLENVVMEYPPLRRSFVRSLADATRKRAPMTFALNNVNLTLEDGDRVALLGPNGAGKTTLLSVMAGIYPPLRGRVTIEGTMETLFSISAGVDRELPGHANINLHLRRLGVTGKEAKEARAYIAELSELGGKLDSPVHTYSAGMSMRLAFAMAMATDPEILLIDEYFGAGDRAFQEKARAAMLEKVEHSRIVVFASHNPRLLESICNKALIMNAGQVQDYGDFEPVIARYLESLREDPKVSRKDMMETAGAADPPSLILTPSRRAASLKSQASGDTPSCAAISAAGESGAAFFSALEGLARSADMTLIDIPAMFAEQGVKPAARVTSLREDAPATGALLTGMRGWPAFGSSVLATGKVAVLIRDPRELAAEFWLMESGLAEGGLDRALAELDDQKPSRLPAAIAAARGLYETLAAGGAYSRPGIALFSAEAAWADPEGAVRAIAGHLGLAADDQAMSAGAAAFAPPALRSPMSALRANEQGQIRMALNRIARELGYHTPEPAR